MHLRRTPGTDWQPDVATSQAGGSSRKRSKRAKCLKDGVRKLKASQQSLTEAAVQKVTGGPTLGEASSGSSDAPREFAAALRRYIQQREDILEEHGK